MNGSEKLLLDLLDTISELKTEVRSLKDQSTYKVARVGMKIPGHKAEYRDVIVSHSEQTVPSIKSATVTVMWYIPGGCMKYDKLVEFRNQLVMSRNFSTVSITRCDHNNVIFAASFTNVNGSARDVSIDVNTLPWDPKQKIEEGLTKIVEIFYPLCAADGEVFNFNNAGKQDQPAEVKYDIFDHVLELGAHVLELGAHVLELEERVSKLERRNNNEK